VLEVLSCVTGDHNLVLVAVAAAICVAGAWASFRLFVRARDTTGWTRSGWLFLTGMTAGSAIWCTHFVAMLAYGTSAAFYFDPVLTIVSLCVAVAGTAAGFALASSGRLRLAPEAGGALIGLALVSMHYIGIAAYHVDGLIAWDTSFVIASIVVGIAFSMLSLNRVMRPVTTWCRRGAKASFVLAIVSMHFTAMTAMRITPLRPVLSPGEDYVWVLALAVALVAVMVIGMGVVIALIDHDTRTIADADVTRLTEFDPLTGLGSRTRFTRLLQDGCACVDADEGLLCLVLVDLDEFHVVNDLRGQLAGDAYLAALGARARAWLEDAGEAAEVARIGGDEFAVLKWVPHEAAVDDLVERIALLFGSPVRASGTMLACSASLGVALYPEHGLSPSDLLANAGVALGRAKNNRLAPVQYCDAVMDTAERGRRALAVSLRGALDRGELELYFQPQMDVPARRLAGAEALVRWTHPQHGCVSPARFIPIAEENGLIVPIGEWVLREACRQARGWDEPVKVAVNLSVVQLQQPDLVTRIAAILEETGIDPARVELEVTETALMADMERCIEVLHAIRTLGVAIALDDFGTGYSALSSLRVFPFDRIKLDRDFARDLSASAEARAIVHAVLMLGETLGTPVLAEGVETEEQLAFLRAAGCPTIQGYLYARPLPAAAMHDFAKASHRERETRLSGLLAGAGAPPELMTAEA
jgi:diguanylate cyclase (GGDEF)-like protein